MPLTLPIRLLYYLFRDQFTISQSAPLGPTRNADTGIWTITDTGNNLSIVGGKLRSANAVTGHDDPRIVGPAITRVVGRALLGRIAPTVVGTITGWANSTAGGTATCLHTAVTQTMTDTRYFSNGSVPANSDNLSSLTEFEICLALRSAGCLFFMRTTGSLWKLVWVDPNNSTSPLYPSYRRLSIAQNHDIDDLRVIDLAPLDSRFATDYGFADSRISGSVADGTTFPHNKDAFIEITIGSSPASGVFRYQVRKQDASNYWEVRYTWPARQAQIVEVVAGVETVRATSAVGGTAPFRFTCALDGNTIRACIANSNNVITYTSAVNFATATSGSISLGGATASNLAIYPTYNTLPSV